MRLYVNKVVMPKFDRGCVLTIGSFDGVHLGHKRILATLRERATEYGVPSMAMLFEPQPREYFARLKGSELPYRLSPLRDKIKLLEEGGDLDNVWAIRFEREFAGMEPDRFVKELLVDRLGVKHLLIGDDFRFGKNRAGDFALLSSYPEFATERTPSYMVRDVRASSTLIREALEAGRLDEANRLLGHDYVLTGRVAHGKRLGRTIGSPTANVSLPFYRYALAGVFVTECQIEGEDVRRPSVSSFGFNPTVEPVEHQKLETHIFDYDGVLYGRRVRVFFKKKIRDEIKFDSLDALKERIAVDVAVAKEWFGHGA